MLPLSVKCKYLLGISMRFKHAAFICTQFASNTLEAFLTCLNGTVIEVLVNLNLVEHQSSLSPS